MHFSSSRMTLAEDIRNSVAPEWEGFERLMGESLTSRSDLLNKINNYLLDASGKKLRPLLALVTAKACSGSINQKAVACAAVSELIHTATLLHDDVVDDSDQRRGRTTVRKLFSPGTSLLIGDYWLTRAIHLLISYSCPYEVLGIYSKALEELSEGEIIQMELADSLRATEDDYIQVIRRKLCDLCIVDNCSLIAFKVFKERAKVVISVNKSRVFCNCFFKRVYCLLVFAFCIVIETVIVIHSAF